MIPQMSPVVWLIFPVVVLVMSVMMMIVNEDGGVQVGFENNMVVVSSVEMKW